VPLPRRHPLIFSTIDALFLESCFEIVNDDDPVPLHFEFERISDGLFSWQYVEAGPGLWQVRISRTRTESADGAPHGCRGGGGCGCSGR
jgi:uncharacterized protein (DUF2249 family)